MIGLQKWITLLVKQAKKTVYFVPSASPFLMPQKPQESPGCSEEVLPARSKIMNLDVLKVHTVSRMSTMPFSGSLDIFQATEDRQQAPGGRCF